MQSPFTDYGTNDAALFKLQVFRGEGMALLAMDWANGEPPADFVGFSIEYMEPRGDRFYPIQNRLSFEGTPVSDKNRASKFSPIQMFRWIHFPYHPNLDGLFTYRVTPVFMGPNEELSYGDSQKVQIALGGDTFPNQLNVAFTRGFVASQAFVDCYEKDGSISTLIPENAEDGLSFKPTHPDADEALAWMGFEARSAILDLLAEAVADTTCQVRVIAFDLNEPQLVAQFEKLKGRLKIIIDCSKDHIKSGAAENTAAARLAVSAGTANVKRQKMGSLQHNKTIIVTGPNTNKAIAGSTNFSWRGFFVQNNNAIILNGANPARFFATAFDNYWNNSTVPAFGATDTTKWTDLGLSGIDAKACFSPRNDDQVVLGTIAADIDKARSNLFFSLAFLYQTPGVIRDSVLKVIGTDKVFSYGISDKKLGGVEVTTPQGDIAVVYPGQLSRHLPEPFKKESSGGKGVRMHHKFIVIDFDKPAARVYVGSYNFSIAADNENGENLLCIRNQKIAVSYVVEALSMFDHYQFRILQNNAKKAKAKLYLAKPPKAGGEPWWKVFYNNDRKINDRKLFSKKYGS